MAKAFVCQCGKPWYKCMTHKNVIKAGEGSNPAAGGDIKERKNLPSFSSKARRLRKREAQDNLEGYNKISKRRKSKACEPFFSINMLSAGLKRKFAHLCQQDED